MGKKKEKKKVRPLREPIRPEQQLASDKLTARYVARVLRTSRNDLAELLAELKTLERNYEIARVAYVLQFLEDMEQRMLNFEESGVWECD